MEQNGDKTVNSEDIENIDDTEWGKQRAYNAAQQQLGQRAAVAGIGSHKNYGIFVGPAT